jgi:dTDP-4-amino-4,6-dideoxygalactose transaminase
MELQAAIGIAQLAKLDYAIKMQRENKRKIKEAIKGAGKFCFRSFVDPDGEAADTLVLIFESPEGAKTFVQEIRARGLTTKNLPDAFNWHFAGTWGHIFSPIERYKGGLWNREWKKSEELLRRAVAMPVFIRMPDEQIDKTINAIREAVQKVK